LKLFLILSVSKVAAMEGLFKFLVKLFLLFLLCYFFPKTKLLCSNNVLLHY
jgi:hypothetical protein